MIRIAWINIKKWHTDLTVWLIFAVLTVFAVYYFGPFLPFAAEHDETLSAWAVSAFFSTGNMIILYVALLGLMFSNAPFYDASSQFSLIRTGRFKWIMGQIIYIFAASFLMVASVWIATWIMWLPRISFANDWGRVVKSAAMNLSLSPEHPLRVFFPTIINNLSPMVTAAFSFLLSWLVSVFTGMLFMFFNFFCGRIVSFSVFGFLWFMSMVPSIVNQFQWGRIAEYIAPFDFANIFTVYQFNGNPRLPPLWYALVVLCAGILVFSAPTVIAFCRKDLDAGKEE